MTTIRFYTSLKEDAWNWVRLGKLKQMPYGRKKSDFQAEIPPAVLVKIKKLSHDQAVKYVYKHLTGRRHKFERDFTAMQSILDDYFRHDGQRLLKEVAKLTARAMYTKKFNAAFTLLHTCPYDPRRNWFMVSAKRNVAKQINTVCHEILHLQFIHYYYDYCRQRGLTEKQFQDIKEALTVLLNEPQFHRFPIGIDQGYPDHVDLRKRIVKLWRRRRNYKSFLDQAIAVTAKLIPA